MFQEIKSKATEYTKSHSNKVGAIVVVIVVVVIIILIV